MKNSVGGIGMSEAEQLPVEERQDAGGIEIVMEEQAAASEDADELEDEEFTEEEVDDEDEDDDEDESDEEDLDD